MVTKKTLFTPNFYCEKCDFKSCNKKDFARHTETKKHKIMNLVTLSDDFTHEKPNYICDLCSKKYSSRNGLWIHKKKCLENKIEIIKESSENTTIHISNDTPVSNDIIIELVKQNQEFKQLIIDQNKKIIELNGKVNTTINNCNNTTNNRFNLNFFLNEQCKDALNIMEFVNSLTVKLTDLENIGKLGYSEGISQIFINGLKQLDVFKRPIHCSDLKREILYVKDQDAWEKENDENAKIKKAIKQIANKNIKQIPEWQKENPQSQDTTTKKHDEYIKIVGESMGGVNFQEDERNYNKIIKNVSKEVLIDKSII